MESGERESRQGVRGMRHSPDHFQSSSSCYQETNSLPRAAHHLPPPHVSFPSTEKTWARTLPTPFTMQQAHMHC